MVGIDNVRLGVWNRFANGHSSRTTGLTKVLHGAPNGRFCGAILIVEFGSREPGQMQFDQGWCTNFSGNNDTLERREPIWISKLQQQLVERGKHEGMRDLLLLDQALQGLEVLLEVTRCHDQFTSSYERPKDACHRTIK